MNNIILFIFIDEKSNKVQIIHLVPDFFIPDGTTDDEIEI